MPRKLAGLSQIRKGTANAGSIREPAAACEGADENPHGLEKREISSKLSFGFCLIPAGYLKTSR
jgi:hypothetical protein